MDLKYKELVKKAKKLLKLRNELKYEIAKISLDVCDITPNGKVGIHGYTATQFAKDIGVNSNTLHRWRREYCLVVSKIGDKKPNRKAMEETLKKVGKNTDSKDVKDIYQKEMSKLSSKEDYLLADIVKRLKNIDFSINHNLVLNKVNQEYLKDALIVVNKIKAGLDGHFSGDIKKTNKRERALSQVAALI